MSYLGIAIVLLFLHWLLPNWSRVPDPQLVLFWEIIAVAVAFFVSVLSLLRFYARKDAVYLLIGMGFMGASLLDALILLPMGVWDTAVSFSPLTIWNLSAVVLAIFMMGSWLIWFREPYVPRKRRFFGLVTAVVLVNLAYLMGAVASTAVDQQAQVTIITAATFFLIAISGYLNKRMWRHDPFEHWLLISLILAYGSQALFMNQANSISDPFFFAALTLRTFSYLALLTGLMISLYGIFNQIETLVVQQAMVNTALKHEVMERKRVEVAELGQRQLAEGLREIGIALSSVLDFDLLLEILLDQIARVLPYDTANVMLVQGDAIEIVVTRGYERDTLQNLPRRFAIRKMPSLMHMMETGEPLIIPNTREDKSWVDAENSPHVASWASAPIRVKGQIIAFLALNNSQLNFYREEDAGRLWAFATQAAVAFENANLYKEVQRTVQELKAINAISLAISSTLNLGETLTLITSNTLMLLSVEAASVALVDKRAGDLWFAAASGLAADFVQGKRLAMGQGIIGWVAQHGQPLLVPDVRQDGRHFGDFDSESGFIARSVLCVPLQTRGQTIGAIEALNKINMPFREDDTDLLIRLAIPAATAIENAGLFEQAQQEIGERKRVEAALEAERALLARRVAERTADLSAANEQLARAARLKDEFLASMSHELRTPLNAILGISEALQEEVFGPLNEQQLGSLHSIEESGRHLLALINDILDLSKIEAGKLEMELAYVPVEAVCQASLRLIKQNAHKKRLRIHSSYDSAVSSILADERRLKQILVNLLSNAVKFTPEGGQVGLEVVGDVAQSAVHITVWDTGIGISDADLARLFQPFMQLDSRLSREFGGTGLGLSLVARMMDLHEGSVSVESDLGVGSRFTISFPWQGVEAPTAVTDTAVFVHSLKKVLLVEDSPTAVAQMKRYLREHNIDTLALTRGEKALEKARTYQPDFIMLDLLLPDISGWDLLVELQADPLLRQIPVVVVSVIDEREQAISAGAVDCLLKPVSREQLVKLLIQIANLRQLDAENRATPTLTTNRVTPRLLLAEDNEANIMTFTRYLRAKGYDVTVARNGYEAIEQAKQMDPHLIIMDIQMPRFNGLDAMRRLRNEEGVHVPIIAVTALAMPGDRERCLEAGANAYMSKPVSLKKLVAEIQTLMAVNEATRVQS